MRKILTIVLLVSLSTTAFAQEIISGMDKVQLEQSFLDGLLQYRVHVRQILPDNLIREGKDLYVSDNGFYETEGVRNRSYFRRQPIMQPLCESAFPVESVFTLLTGYTGNTNFTVHLIQHRYNYETEEVEIPLAQLLQYCQDNGFVPYVGIETREENLIVASLFMVHPGYGFCHTFKFSLTPDLLDRKEGVFHASAYTFTPIHNLCP